MTPNVSKQILIFARNEHGITALEFGLIGPVFLAAVLAWIEMGMCLFISATLDNAVRDASRLIQTGTATESSFKAAICAKVSPLMPCSGISYAVQAAPSFGTLALVSGASGSFTNTFNAGSSGSDVLVQVGYQKPVLVGPLLKNWGFGSTILLSSTFALQNENY